jgi:hypothetical protein
VWLQFLHNNIQVSSLEQGIATENNHLGYVERMVSCSGKLPGRPASSPARPVYQASLNITGTRISFGYIIPMDWKPYSLYQLILDQIVIAERHVGLPSVEQGTSLFELPFAEVN